MSVASPSESVPRRSYFGIGSCCLFAIAAGSLMALIAANWNAQYKMAGLEGLIVLPFALLLNFFGSVMGYVGTRRPAENPLSRTGLVLNLLPPGLLAFLIVVRFISEVALGR
jgi:hypothetical protein